MKLSGFTPRQRRILTLLTAAVVLVFGLLGFSVITTLRQPAPSTPSAYSPLGTPTSPPPSPSPPPVTPTITPTPLSPIQSARFVQEVSRIVAELRELPAVEQIPVSFPTDHEVALTLLRRYQEEQPQKRLELYTTLGLIPDLDPLPMPDVAQQAAQISSLYVAEEEQILLVTGRGPVSTEDELAVVRALAHALQDQHFDLETLAPCRPTTDATRALKALVEGDAILTTARYAEPEADQEQMNQLAEMAADAEEPSYAPLIDDPLFQRLRLFPYREGARLANALYEEGGWEAVNRAYARPPCSTEQVLHPEKYLADEPVQQVTLPDLGPTLGEDWTLVRQDTLGELLLGLHLEAYLENDDAAWEAAEGWAGDVLAQWQDKGGRSVVAWRIAWDDLDEAENFEEAYALLVPRFRVPPLIATRSPHDLVGRLWEGPAGAAYLARAGRIVTIVWGPDAETVTAVARALP